MYIKDDVCYANEPQNLIKVIDVKPIVSGKLVVTFSTGEKRLFDTTHLKGSAFEPLKDDYICDNPVLFHGIITWKDGEIDIAPEAVYEESCPYDDNMNND